MLVVIMFGNFKYTNCKYILVLDCLRGKIQIDIQTNEIPGKTARILLLMVSLQPVMSILSMGSPSGSRFTTSPSGTILLITCKNNTDVKY